MAGWLALAGGAIGASLLAGGAALAQSGPAADSPAQAQALRIGLVVLDQERFFTDSAFGKASRERELAASRALEAENKAIEAELIAEEQSLTERRAGLPADEFAALADAFDAKVERIRDEQDAKARAFAQTRDQDRQAFTRAARPLLAQLMADKGAVAIVEKSTVILSLAAIDVTDEAILRIDAALGPGPDP